MVDNSKKCKNCKCSIDRKKTFCNSSCAAIYNNKLRTKKDYGSCLECGTKLKKSKKYCNNNCQQQYERKEIFKDIENGNKNYHETTFRKFMIYKHGANCMECGWGEINKYTGNVPVQLEHIDGNSENNDIKNLKLLCPNCHSLTKTWGGANRGNGRKKRREKRNAGNA